MGAALAQVSDRQAINDAIKSRDKNAFAQIRDSLPNYLDSDEAAIREDAVEVATLAGLRSEDVLLIINRFEEEADVRVRTVMLKSVVNLLESDERVKNIFRSVISPPFESDDVVAIQASAAYKIDGIEQDLFSVLENGSTSLRLVALEALIKNYHIPDKYSPLLVSIKEEALAETESALKVTDKLTEIQQAEFKGSLPAQRLANLIAEVTYSHSSGSAAIAAPGALEERSQPPDPTDGEQNIPGSHGKSKKKGAADTGVKVGESSGSILMPESFGLRVSSAALIVSLALIVGGLFLWVRKRRL